MNPNPSSEAPTGMTLLNTLRELNASRLEIEFSDTVRKYLSLIAHHYPAWLIYPFDILNEEKELRLYSQTILKIAAMCEHLGEHGPVEALESEPNPLLKKWDDARYAFELHMKAGDYSLAEELMQATLADINQYSGPAADLHGPFIHERLSWFYFFRGDSETAQLHALAAWSRFKSQENETGMLTISRRLADICRLQEEDEDFDYWLGIHTRLLEARGFAGNARSIRKLLGKDEGPE